MNSRLLRKAPAALAAVLLALCAPCLRAQGTDARAPETQPARPSAAAAAAARKVDEFGILHGCDPGAHLDNFANELSQEPGSVGYVVAYDALKRAPGTAHLWGEMLRGYLVSYLGFEESCARLVDAGRHKGDELKIELWVVPEGAEPPRVRPAAAKGGAAPFSGKFDEFFAYNAAQFYDSDDGADAATYHTDITRDAFVELLKRQPDSHAFVVVYANREGDPGDWRRVAMREQQKLGERGAGAERLTLIRAGLNEGERKGFQGEEDYYEQASLVELWVGEKDKPPVRHRAEKATLTRAVLVASLGDDPGPDGERRWALENILDALNASPRSTACVVVYPAAGGESVAGPDGREVPRLDLFKLAEELKAELRRRGVEETRVALLNGPLREWELGRVELWAVPYGAALPDPFAEDAVEAGEDEGEGQGEGSEKQTPPPSAEEE